MFESSVNSEGIETQGHHYCIGPGFESSVNSEGIETSFWYKFPGHLFESSVNSEGIETKGYRYHVLPCLRAV